MKQVIQHLGTGVIEVASVPAPAILGSNLLIESTCSLVSPGTERMLLEFGRAGWLERARQQPDKVRQVLEKLRTDGLFTTLEAVQSKLDQPVALGYCNVGRVLSVGRGVSGLQPGERVLSNGGHAELVRVPRNLVSRIPDNVPDAHAALGVLGAIALQGIRLAAPTVGETFVVTGLGLIGLLAVQLLRANGCRVIGIDLDPARLKLAEAFGAIAIPAGEGVVDAVNALTSGRGVDGALLCASTDSSEPVSQAARMCRKRGRIVLVGVTGLQLSRADFYEKEISFQVSCSYGPGRYDPDYEQRGNDYPYGFVRWTEQRNMEAFLQLASDGRLELESLITHRFDVDQAPQAYEVLAQDRSSLGILLSYATAQASSAQKMRSSVEIATSPARASGGRGVCFFGSGNYASRVLMPAFATAGARLRALCNTGSASGFHSAGRHGFEVLTTDPQGVFADEQCGSVVIATRHDSHAELTLQALRAGKNVFVEKPLAISLTQLWAIERELASPSAGSPVLTVGFNRRFAPLAVRMKELLQKSSGPKCVVYTVNAGEVPADHWTQDAEIGGGRIIGEGCHFIDFMRWLVGTPIRGWQAMAASQGERLRDDCATVSLSFEDGSIGTLHYFANGGRRFSKERVEVFAGGAALRLEDYRRLMSFGWRGFTGARSWRQDKGQTGLVRAFLAAVSEGAPAPIPQAEMLEVARVSIECAAALRPSLRG